MVVVVKVAGKGKFDPLTLRSEGGGGEEQHTCQVGIKPLRLPAPTPPALFGSLCFGVPVTSRPYCASSPHPSCAAQECSAVPPGIQSRSIIPVRYQAIAFGVLPTPLLPHPSCTAPGCIFSCEYSIYYL